MILWNNENRKVKITSIEAALEVEIQTIEVTIVRVVAVSMSLKIGNTMVLATIETTMIVRGTIKRLKVAI